MRRCRLFKNIDIALKKYLKSQEFENIVIA